MIETKRVVPHRTTSRACGDPFRGIVVVEIQVPEVTRHNTRIHFIQRLKERLVAGSWLRTFTRRSVRRRAREINEIQKLSCRIQEQEEVTCHE